MKSRVRLLVLCAVSVLLLAAILWLALRSGWFQPNTAPVILPQTTAALPTGGEEPIGGSLTAEVTPQTVQAVVGTLVRPDSYSRSLRVESFWSGGSQSWNVQVWQKSGLTRIRMETEDGSQPVRLMQSGGGFVTVWQEGLFEDAVMYPSSDPELIDALQMLPTYENLLALDPAQIEAAGYVKLDGAWRIMATVREQPTGYRMGYYISIETGLLEAAERWDGDTLLYRMTAETADLAAPEDELFRLDG